MGNCRDVTVEQAAKLLLESDKVLLICHMKPDGDTFGSGFALLYGLQQLGKTARIECSDGFPARYDFLYPGFQPQSQPAFEPQLVVAVDIADPQLFGEGTGCWGGRVDLCIDHHPSNTRYAKQLLLDSKAAATAEIVTKLLDRMGVPVSGLIASALYTGLTTDTGCFRYSNVTPQSHLLAARLIETGIDSFSINKKMFETKSVAKIKLEQMVMDTLEYHYGNKVAIIEISLPMLEATHVPEEDLEGIASIPRQIEGVEVGITLKQKEPDLFRISVRTNERVNASELCARLGGGGHARAAGCTLKGDSAQVKAQLLDALQADFI